MEISGRPIVILDDDPAFSSSASGVLRRLGRPVATASCDREIMAAIRGSQPLVLIFEPRLISVMSVGSVGRLLATRPSICAIAAATSPSLREALALVRDGAFDVFDKSWSLDELSCIVQRAFEKCAQREEIDEGYEDLLRAKDAAEAANRAKSEFLASISHELRTPLNAIIGFSELIISQICGPMGSDQHLSYMNDILMSGHHLLKIINDILDLSRAEDGKFEMVESEVDVRAAIATVLRLVGPKARDLGIQLQDVTSEDLPWLWCDETKLKQILRNLVANAVKFTPSGGHVEVGANLEPGGLALIVRDSGIGIAESDLSRVLQPFVQVEGGLNRRHEGTGLGLPLVNSLVGLHGGTLSLDSALGHGTTAIVTFPVERVLEGRRASSVSAADAEWPECSAVGAA